MRRKLFSALMIPLLLLPGCGERETATEAQFEAFRSTLTEAQTVTANAAVTAEYEGSAASYVLDVQWDGEKTLITVEQPELIAGVTAVVEAGESQARYEGLVLGTGAVDSSGTTPVSAVPVMLDAMAEGYVELMWIEDGCTAVRFYLEETAFCTVWFDRDFVPVRGEICADGRTVITCLFSGWNIDQAKIN